MREKKEKSANIRYDIYVDFSLCSLTDSVVCNAFTGDSTHQVDKANRKENNGADSQSDSQSSVSDSPSTAPPPLDRSQEFPRKPLEPFHLHSFPKVQKSLDRCGSRNILLVCVAQPAILANCRSECLPPESAVHKQTNLYGHT